MKSKAAVMSKKIPLIPLLAVVLGYFCYDYYEFLEKKDSPLFQVKARIAKLKTEINEIEKSLKTQEGAIKELDGKRQTIQSLVSQLNGLKAKQGGEVNASDWLKQWSELAKQSGLDVLEIKASAPAVHEGEFKKQSFEMRLKGAYDSWLAFIDRFAGLNKFHSVEYFFIKSAVKPEGVLRIQLLSPSDLDPLNSVSLGQMFSNFQGEATDWKQYRDPFHLTSNLIQAPLAAVAPQVQQSSEAALNSSRPLGDLAAFDIDQIAVIGIMIGDESNRALLKTPDGQTHLVQERSRVGMRNGHIKRITPRSVIVREGGRDLVMPFQLGLKKWAQKN